MHYLEDYRHIVGEETITGIHRKARDLYGAHVIHINSTYQGGGVAEILSSLVPLMNDVGINTGWEILHGNPEFFEITKKFHNALQGERINFSRVKKELYLGANEDFSAYTHLDHDCVIVHDPQPLPLIKYYRREQPWIWRNHIDLTDPDPDVLEFLRQYMLRYDMIITSNEKFVRHYPPMDRKIVYPAIDPLSAKNEEIPEKNIEKYLRKHRLPLDKPIITQVSRFDKWKDPEGVLKVFERVRREVDCCLVMCGNMASDDPEGSVIFRRIQEKARNMEDVILLTELSHHLVNVLQRSSQVIIQKSTKEGFGLTVTEGMWKERPVVASNVGGIPLQITDGENGFLLEPDDYDGFAGRIVELLRDPELARQIGANAKESVRQKFLITRLLGDYLDALRDLL